MCLLKMKVILFGILVGYVGAQTGFVQDPVDTTVCQDDDATFTCVFFITSGSIVAPGWQRNGVNVDMMRHTIVSNLTDDAVVPVYVSSTITVNSVTVDDDEALYRCDVLSIFNTNNATLTVVVVENLGAVENLTAVDNCATVTASWDITERYCKGLLSYSVTLSSESNGAMLDQFIITDITTDTTHTFDNANIEKQNGSLTVEVFAFTGNITGSSSVVTATTNISPNDLPTAINIRSVSSICVTSFDISWDASNSITCGDVSYEVSISPPPIEGDAVATTVDRFYSVTGLNNSLRNDTVIVTVTARNRAGQGNSTMYPQMLPMSRDPPPVTDVMVSTIPAVAMLNSYTIKTPDNLTGFVIFVAWTRPTIRDPCVTLPISGYYIHANAKNGEVITSDRIDDVRDGVNGTFNETFIVTSLKPDTIYSFTVNFSNLQMLRNDILQSCTITSPSANTIRVSCDLVETFNRISVTVSSNSCTCSQPITIVGDNPITVPNLTTGVYIVEVIAVNSNDMRVESKKIVEMITLCDTTTSTGESDSSTSSSGATIAITSVVTLLVSVTVTAIVTSVITHILTKRKYESTSQDTSDKVLYEQVQPSSPSVTKIDPQCQKNPAYDVGGRVTMDTNPAYESYK